MEIRLDKCEAEVFLGDGEGVLSMLTYNGNGEKVFFFAEGKAELHIEKREACLRLCCREKTCKK